MAKKKQLPRVAYFCMEYGLRSDFRIYAGGLGILAGDYLKGARDHGYPIVGIGILWKQGYGDQMIDANGQPFDAYRNYRYDFLKDTGVSVTVTIRNREVKCKVWLVDTFDNAPLYLLDTNLPENEDAWITGQLYGWFGEERIAQEMVLGIGGVRALQALGIDVDVYHFNEGHALFAGFELLRQEMEAIAGKKKKKAFKEALERVRQKVVFTTHTPVVQGNESHPIDRMLYMGANLGLTPKQLRKLGGDPFNMTVGALRLSRMANAVAQLHGNTANKMWEHVKRRAPIIAITNGVHVPTWVDPRMLSALKSKKKDAVWAAHQTLKQELLDFIAKRTGRKLAADKLLIGFARRAVAYKRADLIFRKPELIEPLLKKRTVQLVFSGKSHPLDDQGKEIVANLVAWARRFPDAVVFLENYDMEIGAHLTRGADVWLNNPVRPKEASGTSGMKAAMNGVLNCSILDGWWPEACQHGINGWQFGDGFESPDPTTQDAHDLEALWRVLTQEVIPTYYDDRKKWETMMRASIRSTLEKFSVKRMLEEYYGKMYHT